MAFEIPRDLIRDVQNTLRKHAGIPTYDPSDSSLPSLPSLNDAISGFEQSPPYLRCKQCNGMFLRGLASFICVYCGQEQKKDLPPDPIKFTSTVAYHWLLDALDLDGSETIGPSVEESESNRGQNRTQNDEILLFDLLDLELKWSEETERVEEDITNSDGTSLQGKPAVNVAAADLDNYFTKAKNKSTIEASENQLSQNTESYTSQGKQNINLFENVQPLDENSGQFANWEVNTSERNSNQGHENLHSVENILPSKTEERSTNDKSSDRFSGWETEFQSGSSETPETEKDSSSLDTMVGSTVDLSVHIDTVFGSGNIAKEVKPIDKSAPSASTANNWIEDDDVWSEFNSGVANQAEQREATTSISRLQDEQRKSRETRPTDNESRDSSDSFDTWNDFTSSIKKIEPSDCLWSQNSCQFLSSNDQTPEPNLISYASYSQSLDFSSFEQPDLFTGTSVNNNDQNELDIMQLEASALDRTNDKIAKDEATTSSEAEDVEMVMSQMHDLSFMLHTNLSIPKN